MLIHIYYYTIYTGPANPNPAISLQVTNVTYDSFQIQWTIASLAYTPEQYTVYYGTSQTSLTSIGPVINGTNNYSLTNVQYTAYIDGLAFNTRYFVRIQSNNTEGVINSDTINFTTINIEGTRVHMYKYITCHVRVHFIHCILIFLII